MPKTIKKRKLHKSSKDRVKTGMFVKFKKKETITDVHKILILVMLIISMIFFIRILQNYSI